MKYTAERFSETRAVRKRRISRQIASLVFGDFLHSSVPPYLQSAHVVSLTGPNVASHQAEWTQVLGNTGHLFIAERDYDVLMEIGNQFSGSRISLSWSADGLIRLDDRTSLLMGDFFDAADRATKDLRRNHSHGWFGQLDNFGRDYAARRPNAIVLDYDGCATFDKMWRAENQGGEGLSEKLTDFAKHAAPRVSGPIWICFTCSARDGLYRSTSAGSRAEQIRELWNKTSRSHTVSPPLITDRPYSEVGGAPMCSIVLRADRKWKNELR